MENEVRGYKSPLFGRRTAQIKLEGFDYNDAGKTRQIILGECKWRENVNNRTETEKLVSKGHLLPEYAERHYYLFVKSPTEKGQEHNDTTIVTADMLFDI